MDSGRKTNDANRSVFNAGYFGVHLVFGPLIAVAAQIAILIIISGLQPNLSAGPLEFLGSLAGFLMGSLMLGWFLGVWPALIYAILMTILAWILTPHRIWLYLAPVMGAGVGTGYLVVSFGRYDAQEALTFGGIPGFVSAVGCYWIARRMDLLPQMGSSAPADGSASM
jgi:hypothetical protein